MLRSVVGPLRAGPTYRRFVHLLLGAVLLLPYAGLVVLFASSIGRGGLDAWAAVLLGAVAVVVGVGVTLVPGVRALEIAAARALLDARIPEPDPVTLDAWPARLRAALWLLLNLAVGAAAGVLTLLVVPLALGLLAAPWLETAEGFLDLPRWVMPPLGVVVPVLFLHVVAAAGGGLARLAPRLLGPSAAELLAVELAAARAAEHDLAVRNRLARELHDSVGHALTVTTLQAGAAARVLDSDPAFVARALDAIAEAGRTALEELDHALGVLRAGPDPAGTAPGSGVRGRERPETPPDPDRTPDPDLARLPDLLDRVRAAGTAVDVAVSGDHAELPRAVSREAYRVVQEAVTNALKHAPGAPVTIRLDVGVDRTLTLDVRTPLVAGPRGTGGGRGIAGVRERVRLLGGTAEIGAPDGGAAGGGAAGGGAAGGEWRVAVVVPAAPGPVSPGGVEERRRAGDPGPGTGRGRAGSAR